jgi:soluble lytic murein transglycosylase-like protein
VTRIVSLAFVLIAAANLSAGSPKPANPQVRRVAEYYAAMYAQHYHVPVPLVRAIIQRESNWQPWAVSPKGAKGLMQLMPTTARRLGVRDSCNIEQNISGGVRYLAWLMRLFHNDLRLVAAGYLRW